MNLLPRAIQSNASKDSAANGLFDSDALTA